MCITGGFRQYLSVATLLFVYCNLLNARCTEQANTCWCPCSLVVTILKLRACTWLSNYLKLVVIFDMLHQAFKGIFLADDPHMSTRSGLPLVKS